MEKDLILALDIGTSSVRAGIYDDAGNVLPQTFVKNERTLTATDDGGAEIDGDEAFEQVAAAIDDVLQKAEKISGEITHVAASSFWHSLIGVDKNGKPTTKVLGWADTRSRGQVAKFEKSLTKRRYITGPARDFIQASGRRNCFGFAANFRRFGKNGAVAFVERPDSVAAVRRGGDERFDGVGDRDFRYPGVRRGTRSLCDI